MKNTMKRALSLILVLLMAIPNFAFAEAGENNLDPAVPVMEDFMIGGDGDA